MIRYCKVHSKFPIVLNLSMINIGVLWSSLITASVTMAEAADFNRITPLIYFSECRSGRHERIRIPHFGLS